MKHKLSGVKEVFSSPILKVLEQTCTNADDRSTQVFTLTLADWVNVVPITSTGEVVLVEQHRYGTDSVLLETPGGAVDPGEKDLTLAALRELEEETGLTSERILALPGFFPNPAIQGNRITFFVAFDVHPVENPCSSNDPFEQIKLHLKPFERVVEMVRTGEISHSLAALAVLMAEPYFKTRFQR
jgi:8-oxo-dGTP pyrophosphatase MutT (NUDIX family)